MGLRQVPVALPRRFVLEQAEVKAERHVLQALREPEIRRRGVHRIAAHDDEHLDALLVHVLDQLAQRLHVIDRPDSDGVGVDHGLADVAKVLIDGVGQEVDRGRLAVAGHDDGRSGKARLVPLRARFRAW